MQKTHIRPVCLTYMHKTAVIAMSNFRLQTVCACKLLSLIYPCIITHITTGGAARYRFFSKKRSSCRYITLIYGLQILQGL